MNVGRNRLLQSAGEIFHLASTISMLSLQFSKYVTIVVVHIEDYIQSPRSVIEEGVDCPQDYVEECARKGLQQYIKKQGPHYLASEWALFFEQQMIKFPFFKGYSFKDDFRSHT